MPNPNTQVLRAVPVALPPLEEQRGIVDTIEAVNAKIAAAERKRARRAELFRVVLRELMTGRVRVSGAPT